MAQNEIEAIKVFENIKHVIKEHYNFSGHLYPGFDFIFTESLLPQLVISCVDIDEYNEVVDVLTNKIEEFDGCVVCAYEEDLQIIIKNEKPS